MAGYSDPSDYLSGVLGSPVTLTSGYRSPQHNALVGGVPNSAHLTGQAYDFVPKGISTKDAADRLAKSGIPFDQVIDENDHVHISFAPTNRRQVIPSKMVKNVSDDDLLAVMGGSSASAPVAVPQKNVSDDQLLSVMGGAGEAAGGGSASAPAKASGAKSSYMGKPFGFTEEVESHIPFAKDFAAGVPAALDALTGKGSLGTNYRQNLSDYNAAQAGYEANNPAMSGVGTGLGILASGGPAKAAASAIPQTLGQLMKAGAKGGATLGALFGAGEAGDGSGGLDARAGNAAMGAGLGGLTGGVLPAIGAGVAAGGRAVGGLVNRLIPDAATQAANRAKGIIETFAGGPVSPNAAELVPGSKATLAEATANPGVAALHRALRDLNPNSPLITREAENAAARGKAFEGVAGTPEDIEAMATARGAEGKKARDAIFAPTKGILGAEDHAGFVAATHQADTAPVMAKIDAILEGSSGNRPAVVSAMADAKKMLQNQKGEALTDPKTLYDSARKGINDLISGKDLTKSYGATAASQLIAVRDALDEAIEKQAPGFKAYLSKYEEDSGPIDALKFLQSQNVTDAKGDLTLAKVQAAIKRLDQQQAAPGVKQGKSVTDAQRHVLESIRDDLLRAQNILLGKAIGSNTVQNAMAQKRLGFAQRILPEGLGATAGAGLGHLVAGPYGAEVGGFIGDRIGAAVGASRMARQQQSQNLLQATLEDMLLNPAKYQNPHQSIPSAVRPLNDILSGPKARAALAAGNRLVIAGQSRPKEKSR